MGAVLVTGPAAGQRTAAWLRQHRRDVVALGCFLLVLATCLTIVVVRTPSSPGTPPPSTTPTTGTRPAGGTASPTPVPGRQPQVVEAGTGPLLPGVREGTVYVQALTAVYRLDLATGRIVRTPTPPLEQHSSFVAGDGRVIFKSIGFPPSSGSQPSAQGTVVVDDAPAAPLPPALDFPGRLYPGPQGDLWSVPEVDNPPVTVTRYTFAGDRRGGRSIASPGYPVGDATGSLLITNAAGVYQLTAQGPRYLTRGGLLAVGRHHLLVWDCDRSARCRPYRLDRATGRRTARPELAATIRRLNLGADPADVSYSVGDLSPDGRQVVLTSDTGNNGSRVDVVDLDRATTHTVDGTPTDVNANTQSAWTPDSRWLLTLTDHRIRAYDTTTDQTKTLGPTNEDLLHLTMTGASGN